MPGFETEAYGPVYASIGAGGLAWRIGVYSGEWDVPADQYRDWLWRACGYNGLSGRRADEELRMRMHEGHGAIPTVTVSSADEIRHPNKAVATESERSAGSAQY